MSFGISWPLASMIVICAALVGAAVWYERSRPTSRMVAMIAALAALAIAGRVVAPVIPNVQATSDVTLLSGYVFGPGPGFMIGSIAALASNMFLGQGPWTPWQMLGWGMLGVGGAALARVTGRRLGRIGLALTCALAGFAYGAWMDLSVMMNFSGQQTGDSYFVIAATSFPFNFAHAIGNFVLAFAFGPAFVRLLERFRERLEVTWKSPRPARVPAATTAAISSLVLLVALSAPLPALADPYPDQVVEYEVGTGGGYNESAMPGVVLGGPHGGGSFSGSLDVFSLGKQGSITLRFGPGELGNGPGPDLTVFENAFLTQGVNTGGPFAEPATVSVSNDGSTFMAFPCELTQAPYYAGCAGVYPVWADVGNPSAPAATTASTAPIASLIGKPVTGFAPPAGSGGDSFDLSAVGLSEARFVRVTSGGLANGLNGTAGFDLDAIAALGPGAAGGEGAAPAATGLAFGKVGEVAIVKKKYRKRRGHRRRPARPQWLTFALSASSPVAVSLDTVEIEPGRTTFRQIGEQRRTLGGSNRIALSVLAGRKLGKGLYRASVRIDDSVSAARSISFRVR